MKLSFCIHFIVGFFLIIVQSNANWLQDISLFQHLKINLIFIYLIRVVLLYPTLYSLVLILCLGLVVDINASDYLGFYMSSFYVSLLINIFIYRRLDYYFSLPVFLLMVLLNTLIKGIVESIIIIPFMDIRSSFFYFKSQVLAETINNALFSPFIYFILAIGDWLLKPVKHFSTYLSKKIQIKNRYFYK